MTIKRRLICALSAGAFGAFVLAGAAQQKSSGSNTANANQQAAAVMAQQQLQLSAQNASPALGAHPGAGNAPFTPSEGTDAPVYFQDQIRLRRNDERQKRLESDAGRLLALANLLKGEIAASGSESMSPTMIRQMDEIEKLARSVKDRMRN